MSILTVFSELCTFPHLNCHVYSPVDGVADDAEHLLNIFPLCLERSGLSNLQNQIIKEITAIQKQTKPVRGLPRQLGVPVKGFPQVC